MRKHLVVLFLASFFSLVSFNEIQSQEAYLKKGYTVAFSETYFKEMISATSSNDKAYFDKLIKDKKIMVLPDKIDVVVISSSALKGTVVARLKGKDIKLWTVYEALTYK